MADKKFRVFKLRTQDEKQLAEGLSKLKEELQSLRVSKVAGGTASKLGRIKVRINAQSLNLKKKLFNINQKKLKKKHYLLLREREINTLP